MLGWTDYRWLTRCSPTTRSCPHHLVSLLPRSLSFKMASKFLFTCMLPASGSGESVLTLYCSTTAESVGEGHPGKSLSKRGRARCAGFFERRRSRLQGGLRFTSGGLRWSSELLGWSGCSEGNWEGARRGDRRVTSRRKRARVASEMHFLLSSSRAHAPLHLKLDANISLDRPSSSAHLYKILRQLRPDTHHPNGATMAR